MAWYVHYWDETNGRNIRSSEISTREDAMRNACSLMRGGYVVSHVAGPHGERVDIKELRKWCSADTRQAHLAIVAAGKDTRKVAS
jgi:hypothetical protein